MTAGGRAVVDAVLCNFNQARWLDVCLGQLACQTLPLRTIHVVDNASTDDSRARIDTFAQRTGAPVVLHRRTVNDGGAGGFAFGTAEAMRGNPDFLLLLDSDAFPGPGAVAALVERAQARTDVGVFGPKLYRAHREGHDFATLSASRVIQEIGANIDWAQTDYTLRYARIDEASSGPCGDTADVDYVPACTLLARAEAVRRCGTMDPSFFIYWDDIDWCARIRKAGYRIEGFAGAESWHVGGGGARTSLLPIYYHWRNRIRYFGQHGAAGGHPEAVHRAVFIGLRAAFVCRWFGQAGTASLITRAVEDGWHDRRGTAQLPAAELRVEPVSLAAPAPDSAAGVAWIQVDHILECPETAFASGSSRTVVVDRFGKRLWLDEARRARHEFDTWYPARLDALRQGGSPWS